MSIRTTSGSVSTQRASAPAASSASRRRRGRLSPGARAVLDGKGRGRRRSGLGTPWPSPPLSRCYGFQAEARRGPASAHRAGCESRLGDRLRSARDAPRPGAVRPQGSVSTLSSSRIASSEISRPSVLSPQPERRVHGLALAVTAAEDPLEHAAVLPEPGPEELAFAVLAKPVDVEDPRHPLPLGARPGSRGRSSRPCCSRRRAASPSGRSATMPAGRGRGGLEPWPSR